MGGTVRALDEEAPVVGEAGRGSAGARTSQGALRSSLSDGAGRDRGRGLANEAAQANATLPVELRILAAEG